MKRLILSSALVLGALTSGLKANSPENIMIEQRTTDSYPILATAHYNLNDPEFSFSHDFEKKIGNFNIAFASHFYISGKHLEFTVSQEDFKSHFVREGKSYYDLLIEFGVYQSDVGAVRIYYSK